MLRSATRVGPSDQLKGPFQLKQNINISCLFFLKFCAENSFFWKLLFLKPFQKSDIKESMTANSLSCLVAAKLVTSLYLEAFSLTGFGHDGR